MTACPTDRIRSDTPSTNRLFESDLALIMAGGCRESSRDMVNNTRPANSNQIARRLSKIARVYMYQLSLLVWSGY